MKPTKGFTLIELVVVIVILGILAATALPKFVDLGKDARIAAVNAGAGAIRSAGELARGKCVMVPGCFVVNGFSSVNMQAPGGATSGPFYNGYPQAIPGPTNGSPIREWVDLNGFDFIQMASHRVEFQKTGAKTPNNCKVIYDTTLTPFVSTDVSDC